LALYADILSLAIARGKIFGIKGQPVVKSVYIQAPMNYLLIKQFTYNFSFLKCSVVMIKFPKSSWQWFKIVY